MLFLTNDQLDITRQSYNALVGELKQDSTTVNYLPQGGLVSSFEGVNSLMDYQREHMATAKHSGASNRKPDSDLPEFHHFKDYQEALDTYSNHPESVREFTENDLKLEGGDSAGLRVNYDLTGEFVDIDRYLTGQPDCFGSMDNGLPRGQRVTIVTTNDWVHSANKSTINTRATRLLRLVDWLESQGIRTQLIALTSTECAHTETTIKHFDQPLDLNSVAIVSHSDWLRRIMFRMTEYSKTYSMGYGTSTHCTSLLNSFSNLDKLPVELRDSHVLFVGQSGDPDSAFDKLETSLADILTNNEDNKLMKVMI